MLLHCVCLWYEYAGKVSRKDGETSNRLRQSTTARKEGIIRITIKICIVYIYEYVCVRYLLIIAAVDIVANANIIVS